VLVFGPTDPARHVFEPTARAVRVTLECSPCHDHGPERCPLRHHRCMGDLSVDAVEGQAVALLGEAGPRPPGAGGGGERA
jgi:heptosyltransferase-2